MMGGNTPIYVLKEGTKRNRGKEAQNNNIAAAKAISDAVRSTLGPRGMDKMLVDSMGDVTITNDGVTLLKEMDIEHPAAKMLVEVAKTQDEECGDGTTTAVVLAGELLKRAEELIDQNVHPTIIVGGYRMASDKAIEILEGISENITIEDTETLKYIAATAITGKSAEAEKDLLSTISVEAVTKVAEKTDTGYSVDIGNIKIEKKHGGTIGETRIIQGLLIDKERVHSGMPKRITDAKIALIDSALEIKKTEVDAKYQISDPSQFQTFLAHEEKILKDMADKITAAGANVVICQKGIDDMVQHFLSKKGVFAIRRAKKSDMEMLAKATCGTIITNLDDLSVETLGTSVTVEEAKIGDDDFTFITGCPDAKATTILVRGGSEHVVAEIERALHDSLSVVALAVEDGKVTFGGGSAAVEIADGLREFAKTVSGREQLAIEAYAKAIEIIPRTLAENAGFDPVSSLIDLRAAHENGEKWAGLGIIAGGVTDMKALHVIEPLRVNKQAIQSATESSAMILRIDDVIAGKQSGMPPGAGGMPGGMDMDY